MLYVIQGLLQEYPPETYRVLRAVTYSTAVILRAHSKATAWTAVRSGRELLGAALTADSGDCSKSRAPAKRLRREVARYCKVKSLSRPRSDKSYAKHAEEARRAATDHRKFHGSFVYDKKLYLSGGSLPCPSHMLAHVDCTISLGAEEKQLEQHTESGNCSKAENAETSCPLCRRAAGSLQRQVRYH